MPTMGHLMNAKLKKRRGPSADWRAAFGLVDRTAGGASSAVTSSEEMLAPLRVARNGRMTELTDSGQRSAALHKRYKKHYVSLPGTRVATTHWPADCFYCGDRCITNDYAPSLELLHRLGRSGAAKEGLKLNSVPACRSCIGRLGRGAKFIATIIGRADWLGKTAILEPSHGNRSSGQRSFLTAQFEQEFPAKLRAFFSEGFIEEPQETTQDDEEEIARLNVLFKQMHLQGRS